ncbi:TPA: hypothetical protein UL927_000309 [Stenotrophomonas maltophilia]|nr:hypothetical protein [Stenotrophomonas maltophilia]
MKIHHLVSHGSPAVAITQSASSGGYAHPVKLSAIRFDVKEAETVLGEIIRSGHRHEKKFGQVRRPRREAQSETPAVSEAHYQRVRL